MPAMFTPFAECPTYTQEDALGLSFRKVLPEGVVPDVDMGLVTAEGPTRKFAGTHDWDQVYLIFQGTGFIYLAGKKIRIDSPGIAVIPRGTDHAIEADAGQVIRYIYVNRR